MHTKSNNNTMCSAQLHDVSHEKSEEPPEYLEGHLESPPWGLYQKSIVILHHSNYGSVALIVLPILSEIYRTL